MEQENPFSQMADEIRNTAKEAFVEGWRHGKIVSVSPMVVNMAGIDLTESDLYVNYILREYEQEISIVLEGNTIEGSVDCSVGSISGMTVSGGELKGKATFKPYLKEGDQVVLLQPSDGQKYVVICKV